MRLTILGLLVVVLAILASMPLASGLRRLGVQINP